MHRMDAIAWGLTVCAGSLRLSQAKTLAALVAAAMRVQRVSLANIGRALGGTSKHQIKRCWRFCVNPRVETTDAMQGIVARLLKKRKKKLLVAVDWVDIKGFLMTDQKATALQIGRLYGQRMTIEQLFRDDKSKPNGWSLRDTKITKPDRIDRLLLVLAIAYLLLCSVGLLAQRQFRPSAWCSSNRMQECSIYTIGLILLQKMAPSPPQALAAVVELAESVAPNWG